MRDTRSNDPNDWTLYKDHKKLLQRDCKSDYHNYISDMLCVEGDSNPKRFWSYINSKRCENSGVAPLIKDGVLQSDSTAKSNMLNNQFASVFTNEEASDLPDLGISPHPPVPSFFIDSEGIRKLLANFKPHPASGPVNLSVYLLKETTDELVPILCLLFNATLHQGKIPRAWKSADVTPICVTNTNPISLTSIVCKTAEHIIHSQIMQHLDAHNLLSNANLDSGRSAPAIRSS
ncbi:uncharacterized protein [Amphiura filiformis]|uniref:uncharacterized protein n=1 Tax=Amphiura filiformis TaxID=82378 RepID=UPI003B21C264